jgi:hypothetical protein
MFDDLNTIIAKFNSDVDKFVTEAKEKEGIYLIPNLIAGRLVNKAFKFTGKRSIQVINDKYDIEIKWRERS